MIRRNLVGAIAVAAFALAATAPARAEILEYDCSDRSSVFYNIWVDVGRSTVSMHYVRADLPQDLRTYPAEITPTSIRWAFTGSTQVSLNASIDRATGRYVQVYGGVARGTNTFQCRAGNLPMPAR
jgi:hypothetical protein